MTVHIILYILFILSTNCMKLTLKEVWVTFLDLWSQRIFGKHDYFHGSQDYTVSPHIVTQFMLKKAYDEVFSIKH